MLENRNVTQELKNGMIVAFEEDRGVCIAEVSCIPPNPCLDSMISINLFRQERAPHKPKWCRCFHRLGKICSIKYSDIVLYDFQLTKNGALKKKTRDYLINNDKIIQ